MGIRVDDLQRTVELADFQPRNGHHLIVARYPKQSGSNTRISYCHSNRSDFSCALPIQSRSSSVLVVHFITNQTSSDMLPTLAIIRWDKDERVLQHSAASSARLPWKRS